MSNVTCPECDRALVVTDGVGECYNCTERYEIAQCEGCDGRGLAEAFETESVPGATLWFCADCATTRGIAYE